MIQIYIKMELIKTTKLVSCDIYSFGNPASFGNAAMNKEHKLLLNPTFFHSDHLVIKVLITICAPTPFNIH